VLLVAFGLSICDIVLLFLNAILISVCLKRLVIFLTLGLYYVNVAHFVLFIFSFLSDFWWVVLRCISCLRLVINLLGKLLLCAMFRIVFHPCVRLSFVSGNVSILLM